MAATAKKIARPRETFGFRDRARLALAIIRSLGIYYGNGARRRAMDRLYRMFLRPGDLAFDIGAHVGDRTACFRRLGCRVIAVEPQPALAAFLRLLHAGDRHVSVIESAVGAHLGELALNVNLDNPTVATGSRELIDAARRSPRWRHERWTRHVSVALTTLDDLIARYGAPAFIKIDVEGFEAEALSGLHWPVPALSFEFTMIQREIALRALARCTALGAYRFNAAVGESQRLVFAEWKTADEIAAWLAALPEEANSGDIYVALAPPEEAAVN